MDRVVSIQMKTLIINETGPQHIHAMTQWSCRSEDETQLARLLSYRLVTEVEVTISWKQRFNDNDERVSKYFTRNGKGIITYLIILSRSWFKKKTFESY